MSINYLEIQDFKSIDHLELRPKRFNILIGEPGAGKTNILETLALWSYVQNSGDNGARTREFLRMTQTADLFRQEGPGATFTIRLNDSQITVGPRGDSVAGMLDHLDPDTGEPTHSRQVLMGNLIGNLNRTRPPTGQIPPWPHRVMYYHFPPKPRFRAGGGTQRLQPPQGDNLPTMLENRPDLRRDLSVPLAAMGTEIQTRIKKIPWSHDDEPAVQHPRRRQPLPLHLMALSTRMFTLQTAAILSNNDAAIVLPEPETGMHPLDQQTLAEQIGMDDRGNQYFTSTNSECILASVIQKSPVDSVAVHLVHSRDHTTRVHTLSDDQLEALFDRNPIANAERFLGD